MELVLKKEGDLITPKGVFKVVRIFYRPDKLKKIKSGIPTYEIKKYYKWCTDPKNVNYNSLVLKKLTVFMKIYSETMTCMI